MSGILTLSKWLGGATAYGGEMTPQEQKRRILDIADDNKQAIDISAYTFRIEYQVIVVDTITEDKYSGEPNFTNSTVIGYFPQGTIDAATYLEKSSTTTGRATLTIPAELYTGNIDANAKTNVPMLIIKIEIEDDATLEQIDVIREAWLLRWAPDADMTIGDPTLEATYTAVVRS